MYSKGMKIICTAYLITAILTIVLCSLYQNPNPPKLSIEAFSVPAFNKTSDHDQISGGVYFDLKLRNMNKAIGLYYDDPFALAFSYYPIKEPYQKYVWEYTIPPFYQGNGKTKHIKTLIGNLLQPPPSTVVEEEDTRKVALTTNGNYSYKHVRSLLMRNHLQLPSSKSTVVESPAAAAAAEVVNIRVTLMFGYRFKLLAEYNTTHVMEVGADVMVDANSGERVSKGSVELVDPAAAAAAPLWLVVVIGLFVVIGIIIVKLMELQS